MTLLAGVLGLLPVIAVVYIVVQHLTHWLERGGFTIRIEATDDDET